MNQFQEHQGLTPLIKREQIPRPRSVIIATWIWALAIIGEMFVFDSTPGISHQGTNLSLNIPPSLVYIFFFIFAIRRRDWARWGLLLATTYGNLTYCIAVLLVDFYALVPLVLLEVTGTALLFSKSASNWYLAEDQYKTKIQAGTVLMAILSVLPGLGTFFFGPIAFMRGMASRTQGGRATAALALCGTLATFVAIFGMFYNFAIERGGSADKERATKAQKEINLLVSEIESYKATTGAYPGELSEMLEKVNGSVQLHVFDPTISIKPTLREWREVIRYQIEAMDMSKSVPPAKIYPLLFFYQKVDADHYYLRGVGLDRIPFTPDDVVPQGTNLPPGLLLSKPTSSLV